MSIMQLCMEKTGQSIQMHLSESEKDAASKFGTQSRSTTARPLWATCQCWIDCRRALWIISEDFVLGFGGSDSIGLDGSA